MLTSVRVQLPPALNASGSCHLLRRAIYLPHARLSPIPGESCRLFPSFRRRVLRALRWCPLTHPSSIPGSVRAFAGSAARSAPHYFHFQKFHIIKSAPEYFLEILSICFGPASISSALIDVWAYPVARQPIERRPESTRKQARSEGPTPIRARRRRGRGVRVPARESDQKKKRRRSLREVCRLIAVYRCRSFVMSWRVGLRLSVT